MFRALIIFLTSFSFFVNGINSKKIFLRGRELSSIDEDDMWNHFSIFVERFNKKYDTFQDLEMRFNIFRSNLRSIILHNLDRTQTFTMGINQFTDLTSSEFKLEYINIRSKPVNITSYGCKEFIGTNSNLPSSIDWRYKNAVTSVKDQGQCGSCWTFSATGAIEGALAISTGKLVDLSEQQLVDCANGLKYGSHGCSGGQMDGAFKYVLENGQCSLASYPYTSGVTKTEGSCKNCDSVAEITNCFDVKQNDQLLLKAAVAKQPVSIAIEADTRYFQSYSGGILTSTSCGTNLDHGVLIVGYGEENSIKYWLVKNSWGTTWGDNGYIKIARSESTNDPGICGIAMMASFPVV
jgi:C1A family cysteine protease